MLVDFSEMDTKMKGQRVKGRTPKNKTQSAVEVVPTDSVVQVDEKTGMSAAEMSSQLLATVRAQN